MPRSRSPQFRFYSSLTKLAAASARDMGPRPTLATSRWFLGLRSITPRGRMRLDARNPKPHNFTCLSHHIYTSEETITKKVESLSSHHHVTTDARAQPEDPAARRFSYSFARQLIVQGVSQKKKERKKREAPLSSSARAVTCVQFDPIPALSHLPDHSPPLSLAAGLNPTHPVRHPQNQRGAFIP